MHVGLVGLDGTKMSKSLGNLVFVDDSSSARGRRGAPGAARPSLPPRLGVARRAALEGAVASSDVALDADHGRRFRVLDDVRAALDDDLDTPARAARDRRRRRTAGSNVAPAAAFLGITCRRRGPRMSDIDVQLPDGSSRSPDEGSTALDLGQRDRAASRQGRAGGPGERRS